MLKFQTNSVRLSIIAALSFAAVGCSTTNSVPYKASTSNIIAMQTTYQPRGVKINLGEFSTAAGVEENLVCRLMGPVTVAPGKKLSTYIKEAIQEEMFAAQIYSPTSQNLVTGRIEKLAFSSVSPANWEISLRLTSNADAGYSVSTKYVFDTSFDAMSACKNVADAFAPAVQELIKQAIAHPDFKNLAK